MKVIVGGAVFVLAVSLGLLLWNTLEPAPTLERAAPAASMAGSPSRPPAASASPLRTLEARSAASTPSSTERKPRRRTSLPDEIDWTRFNAGLGAFAATALGTNNGSDALLAARALKECRYVQQTLDFTLDMFQGQRESTGKEIWQAMHEEAQMKHQQCQSVPGDADELRLQLLALAIDAAVHGASAELLMDHRHDLPERLSAAAPAHAVKDALAGDPMSLAYLASRELDSPFASADQILAARLALKALKDDEQGPSDQRYVGTKYFFEATGQLTDERARRNTLPKDFAGQRASDFPEGPVPADVQKLRDQLLAIVRSRLPSVPGASSGG